MSLLRVATFALLLNCLLSQVGNAFGNDSNVLKIRTQSGQSELYKDKGTYFRDGLGIEMNQIHFVECDPVSRDTKIRECRLLRGIQSFRNETTWEACGFQIKPNKISPKVSPYMRVYQFNFSFLVFWIEYSRDSSVEVEQVNGQRIEANLFINFIVIESPTCRIIGEARTVGSSKDLRWFHLQETTSVYLGKETFDVIYAYDMALNLAQESFDMNGTRIRGPVGEADFKMDDFAVTIPWPPADRLTSYLNLWPQERLKARPGYNLEYHPYDALGKHSQGVVGYTTSNGNVTFCKERDLLHWSSWICSQGESNQTRTKFIIKFKYVPHTPIIYNMPGGGVLTVTSLEGSTESRNKTYTLYAQRFEADGCSYEPLKIVKFNFASSTLILGNIFKDVWGYFCFSYLLDKKLSEFTTTCYAEDVLTQPMKPELSSNGNQYSDDIKRCGTKQSL